jgi:uncharacterized membrane-anchored protein YitT (DUF2179 family)
MKKHSFFRISYFIITTFTLMAGILIFGFSWLVPNTPLKIIILQVGLYSIVVGCFMGILDIIVEIKQILKKGGSYERKNKK